MLFNNNIVVHQLRTLNCVPYNFFKKNNECIEINYITTKQPVNNKHLLMTKTQFHLRKC